MLIYVLYTDEWYNILYNNKNTYMLPMDDPRNERRGNNKTLVEFRERFAHERRIYFINVSTTTYINDWEFRWITWGRLLLEPEVDK